MATLRFSLVLGGLCLGIIEDAGTLRDILVVFLPLFLAFEGARNRPSDDGYLEVHVGRKGIGAALFSEVGILFDHVRAATPLGGLASIPGEAEGAGDSMNHRVDVIGVEEE